MCHSVQFLRSVLFIVEEAGTHVDLTVSGPAVVFPMVYIDIDVFQPCPATENKWNHCYVYF